MKKFKNKLDKLNDSIISLKEMVEFSNEIDLSMEKMEEAIRDSVIKKFEYTFELTWKTIKAYLESEGYEEFASPKKVLKQAFEISLINNEELWSNMLEARNNMAHTYDEEKAIYYCDVIKTKYIIEISSLVNKLNNL